MINKDERFRLFSPSPSKVTKTSKTTVKPYAKDRTPLSKTPVKRNHNEGLPQLRSQLKVLSDSRASGSTVRSSLDGPMRSLSTNKKMQEPKKTDKK